MVLLCEFFALLFDVLTTQQASRHIHLHVHAAAGNAAAGQQQQFSLASPLPPPPSLHVKCPRWALSSTDHVSHSNNRMHFVCTKSCVESPIYLWSPATAVLLCPAHMLFLLTKLFRVVSFVALNSELSCVRLGGDLTIPAHGARSLAD